MILLAKLNARTRLHVPAQAQCVKWTIYLKNGNIFIFLTFYWFLECKDMLMVKTTCHDHLACAFTCVCVQCVKWLKVDIIVNFKILLWNPVILGILNFFLKEIGTKRELGSVWGTSVTVPVTIRTSYVPQTEFGNILFLLCFLLCSPNEVWEHIVFTFSEFFLCSPVLFCPRVFSETVHPTELKPF